TDAELAEYTDPRYREVFLACEASDDAAWRSGEIVRSEQVIPTVEGDTRTFDVIKVPLHDDDGSRKGLVVLGRDVTDRKRVEAALDRSLAEWTHAMDSFTDAIYLVGLDDRVVRANQAFYEMVGRRPEEVIGADINTLMHPGGEAAPCPVCRARQTREDAYLTMEADDPSNPTGRPMEVSLKVVRDETGQPTGTLMGLHDLSRSRRTEEELRLAASVFEGSQEGILITAPDHRILRVNQAFCTLTGFGQAEVEGTGLRDLLSTHQDREGMLRHLDQAMELTGAWEGELHYRRKDGSGFPAWHHLTAIRDGHGRVERYIGIFTDISEKKKSENRIYRLAHYDPLTDLPNRILLQERLDHALERSRRKGETLALLFIDLDRFKNINDSLGHAVGDRLLQVVARRLGNAVREQDTVARLGGDEFLVLLEGLEDLEDAGLVARKMLDVIDETIRLGGREVYIGASIGISLFPNDGDTVEALIKNADTAMYRAKEHGRNNYQYYTPELTRLSLERLELETGLRRAIERRELEVYYQPQADLDGRFCGAEALLRWHHGELGMVPPDRFIPLAEESGLIESIGRWVLTSACEEARGWQQPLRVAVNLSGQQILYGDIVGTVREVLEETGLPPERLELEITEGFVLGHAEQGIATLERLRELGVDLAVDDFGTGYSSLSYLKRLPITRLKIDRSFVADLPGDPDDAAIASTIIVMARNLGLEVIAEGVETAEQLAFLREQGCEAYQGFYLGRPVPADAFRDAAEAGRIRAG
ncbi:MAG TPA: EAL domain-containing protein, partial [Gammaproteobacteria bacterium]|nr:EAL domain-containing protein [Gammaproteobacteria bacterium]